MKKFVAIFLLSAYLFTATDCKEFLKMHVVMEHFSEHKKKDAQISFVDFLIMHYITNDNTNADNARDMQLPFKSNETLQANSTMVFTPHQFISFSIHPLLKSKSAFISLNDCFIISNYQALVWHPPQHV